jgi:Zinc knuckle
MDPHASIMAIMNEDKKNTSEYLKAINQAKADTMANSGGGGGYRQPYGGNRGGAAGGASRGGSSTASTYLKPGYICFRCRQPGHNIKDCPTNSDETFDTYQGKGVPKEHLWRRDLGINAQEFLENKPKIFRKIVKEI